MINTTLLIVLLAVVAILMFIYSQQSAVLNSTSSPQGTSSLDSDLTVNQQLTDYDLLPNEVLIPPMP